ncbi:MAG: phosphotransferase [Kordiimonadaceae bacterium]|jgi:N-acetylmuramate 1-kinase|nr:phosphotransferase [Kordiimonadaceae bacterium]MBT6329362.1 phosphotransferase [Kordiimonadaceae bacterium]
MTRSEQITYFLESVGWAGATITALAGDASFRRYDRITLDDKKAVLMDAPTEFEDTKPFVAIAEHLQQIGLHAPIIYASDFSRGFLLLEDLGDDLFKKVLEDEPEKELELYRSAVDELLKINQQPPIETIKYTTDNYRVPDFDMDLLISEISLFSDWYYPAYSGVRLSALKRQEFINVFKAVLSNVSDARECLVLRDYHAENLLLLENGDVGQIDFQDAVIGHSAYDLVSLLQDARRDVDPRTEEIMVRYFADELGRDRHIFNEHYAVLGAQRNIKIIGIFARLYLRDGKDNYLKLIPRVWGLLERCLEHPSLSELKKWLDKETPDERNVTLKAKPLSPLNAMILAAGLGKRMKPLTDLTPKPLLKIAGKELLERTLSALAEAGIKKAVINKHHYPEQIEQFVENRIDWRPEIILSDESDKLLDSGGGVKKALPLLGEQPFYILNSDMIWTNSDHDALSRLATTWHEDMDILMLVIKRDLAHGHDGEGDFQMNDDGRLKFRGDDATSDYMYGGILIIRPECFNGTPDAPFSLRHIFRKVASEGRLFGLLHEGSWYHVGTPESVKNTEKLLKGE